MEAAPDARRGAARAGVRRSGVAAAAAVAAVAGVVALLAAFAGKAFSIDDPLFVWLARHIASSPLDFFGFAVHWDGTSQPMHALTRNPPLTGYYLAAAGALLGWSEPALHAALLLPAAAALASTAGLAARLCGHPLEATLLAALTPAFLTTASNVTCDVMMLAAWCGAVLCWVRGIDARRTAWLVAGACLAGLAALAKYFGAALLPLLLLYGALRERRLGGWAWPLLIPVALLAGFDSVTRAAYGSALFGAAAGYAVGYGGRELGSALAGRAIAGLAFAGGSLASVLAWAPLVLSRRALALGLASAALLTALSPWLVPALQVPRGEAVAARPELSAQLWLMALAGLGLVALCAADLRRRRDAESALLAAWVLGTLAFAVLLNWTINARSILPAAPAIGILLVRRLEDAGGAAAPARALALAAAAGLAVAVAWADARWAGEVRAAAQRIAGRYLPGAGRLYVQGHWGFQYYLAQAGALEMDLDGDVELGPGDWIAVPLNNYDAPAWSLPRARAELVEEFAAPAPRWLRTTSASVGAGFYSSEAGPLPFAFGRSEADRYRVWRVLQPMGMDRRGAVVAR